MSSRGRNPDAVRQFALEFPIFQNCPTSRVAFPVPNTTASRRDFPSIVEKRTAEINKELRRDASKEQL